MSEIKPHYKMPLEEAANKRMTPEEEALYLSFHQISVTRRDD